MKKNWKIILLAVILIGVVAFYFVRKEYNRGPKDVTQAEADVVIKAVDLTTAFSDDETKANGMYLDKAIAVSGVVKSVNVDESGAYTIMLAGSSELSNVSCLLDERHNDDAKSVKVGTNITVKGFCTGVLSDVELNRCAVDK